MPDVGAAFRAAVDGRSEEALRAALSPRFAGKANGRLLDRDAQVQLVASFWAGFPDGAFTWDAVGGSGRQVLQWSFAGTHAGVYLGIPPTGLRVTLSGYTIAVWDATGLLSLDWKWDTKAFTAQVLGPDDLPDSLLLPPKHRPDPSARWARQKQRRRGAGRGAGGGRKPKPKPDAGGGRKDGRPRGRQPRRQDVGTAAATDAGTASPASEATPAAAATPAAPPAEPAPSEAPRGDGP